MCFPAVIAGISSIGTALGGAGAAAGAAAGGVGAAGTLSTALTAGAGILSAFGQYQNAKAQQKAANINAAAQQRAANEAIAAGKDESDKQRRVGILQMGRMRAQMAANNQDPTNASALSFLDEQRELVEEDAFTIRENYRRQAQGMSNQAANSRADAASARSASFFQPLGTVLTTGAKVGAKYADWAAEGAYA